MKTKLIASFLLFAGILVSCTKNESDVLIHNEGFDEEQIITLKERDPNFPLDLRGQKEKSSEIKKIQIKMGSANEDLLGMTWKCNTFPIDRPENKGYSAIDMDKVPAEYRKVKHSINSSDNRFFSFSDFSRYVNNSQESQKFDFSAGVDLDFLSASAEFKYEQIFNTSHEEKKKTVNGYLEAWYEKYNYSFPITSQFKKDAALYYMSDVFKEHIYGSTPEYNFKYYGPYILLNFNTGGKVYAMYKGNTITEMSSEERESKMNAAINSSFLMAENSIGFSTSNTDKEEYVQEFSNIDVRIQAIGGNNLVFSSFGPSSFGNLKLDLKAWAQSISNFNESNHQITRIMDGGLCRISDFIIEKNLKNRYERLYTQKEVKPVDIIEPYIYIVPELSPLPYKAYSTHLVTKYGDNLIIGTACFDPRISDPTEYIDEEVDRLSKLFGVKIQYFPSKVMMSSANGTGTVILPDNDVELYQKCHLKIENMSKITNADGSIYLFCHDKDEDKYYVYTIYDNRVKYIYGIKFLDQVPEMQGSEEEIEQMKYMMFSSKCEVNAL